MKPDMFLPGLLLYLLWLPLVLTLSITKPGCQRQCGNLTVPYPFGIGIGTGCSIGSRFDINCNTSFDPPKPFMRNTNIEVVDISDTQIRIKNSVASTCYNKAGKETSRAKARINITSATFTFSTDNRLTVIGCDDIGFTDGSTGGSIKRKYRAGCRSACSNSTDIDNRYCSGIGCCQASIPKGLTWFDTSISTVSNHTEVWSFNPCGYAFIGEQNKITFGGLSDLSDPSIVNRTIASVPVVLDWAIGNQSCSTEAKNSTNFACQQNSICVDSASGVGGYRCICKYGYEGNPYLTPGCQDINECEEPNFNACESICINTEGSYYCSCPHGYYGDGRKGLGCFPQSQKSQLAIKFTLAGIGAGLGILFLLVGAWWLCKIVKRRKKTKLKEKFFKRNGGLLLQQETSSNEGSVEKTKMFTSKELEKATDNYNENRILGKGGQGTVYKGMLTDGRIIAVKKSKIVDEGGLEQFINEIVIVSQINHRNVVKLLGCCLETEVPMLVYEFIPNGTLSQYIHEENEEFPLSWDRRLQIASEVAGALSYLHSAASIPIYHRDIKSTNILLDDKYRAKVSDFGISRSIAVDQTHLTTLVKGTFGYLDPEYFQSSQFTEKSDVYSFGVVLVELLTGQKPISSTRTEERSLATFFLLTMEENRLFDILDARVMGEGGREEIMTVANLANKCLNLNGKKRPTMKEVAVELEGIRMTRGESKMQQNNEEIEYAAAELTGPWDNTFTNAVYSDKSLSSSLDTQKYSGSVV